MAEEFGHALVTGPGVTDPSSSSSSSSSSARIDVARLLRAAEHYTAEMRRIGQKQSASDMERNIRKARDLVRSAPPSLHHDMRALLEHEKAGGIHQPRGHISDPSGAVGLLWIRRSLAYQHRMFDLVLNHHVSPPDAALQAYRHELQPYHGWALQKLYTLAMSSMTPGSTQELLAKVGGYDIHDQRRRNQQHDDPDPPSSVAPRQDRGRGGRGGGRGGAEVVAVEDAREMHHHHNRRSPAVDSSDLEAACRADLQRLLDVWDPLLRNWRQLYHELDLEDPRRY